MDNTCPKCGQQTWRFNLYMHLSAPARRYGNMGKTAIRCSDVRIEAALWETVSFFCVNPKCMHFTKPARQVRLEPTGDDDE